METENSENYMNKFICEKCSFKCINKGDWKRHLLTAKHRLGVKACRDYPLKFSCEKCAFICSNKNDLSRHLLTSKHEFTPNYMKLHESIECKNCTKSFKTISGLCRHKKSCIQEKEEKNEAFICDKEFVMKVLQQNNDLQKQLIDSQKQMMCLLEKGTHNTNNNNTNNSINTTNKNKFNLNFFLNETCKNAINLTDFVKDIQLQLGDLEKIGQIGYVNGMSDIIVKNLNGMDLNKRPVHCTDKKRQTLYVRDENKWDKEEKDNPKVKKAIRKVSSKNMDLLWEYKKNHPECMESDSDYNEKFNDFVSKICGNGEKEEEEIIKSISTQILVEKEE